MRKIVQIVLCIHLANVSVSQQKDLSFQLRFPVQYELQKAVIPFTWGNEIQKANAKNFGLDALMNYKINKFSIYTGAGFFRVRFNIKRFYDHQAFSGDSLPIGIKAHHYTYSLLRLPFGVHFEISKIKNIQIALGLEHFFNFSLRRKYKGHTTIEGTNTAYNGINYFGNSANFLLTISNPLPNKNLIQVEPYVRIFNKYKKDRFLYENENESISRNFDAFGIGIKYTL